MEIITKKIGELTPYENNPRNNDEAVQYVANSISEFGWKVPVVVDKDNVVVAGHTRLKAAEKLGIDEIPCIVADDLSDEQIKAYRLADNKVSEFATWDSVLLDLELADIDIDMGGVGFEFDNIYADDFGTDFSLPDGEKSEFCTMNFIVHERQKEQIEAALKEVDQTETFGNDNRNGNALYEVCRQWVNARI